MIRWLAISNRENSDVVIKKKIWGVSKRYVNAISKVAIGDSILVYVGQKIVNKEIIPAAITGAFEVTSTVYEDTTSIFTAPNTLLGDEIFPLRIKLKPILIFKEPVIFKPLIPKLKFIKNKKMYTGSYRGKAMRVIPEEDYQLILSIGK